MREFVKLKKKDARVRGERILLKYRGRILKRMRTNKFIKSVTTRRKTFHSEGDTGKENKTRKKKKKDESQRVPKKERVL